jgi:DNA invertase Pin-like site-specific DNA recombinase
MNTDLKITPEHLGRKAVVYLRQSSDGQVRNNLESQRLQYAMADRARELGFHAVEVIDTDLGASAAMAAKRREGFQRLLGSVALGEIGIILSRELSRLLRTDRDFCQLIELCQAFGTLIGDEQEIYDVSRMDDQLVLGIKATMSVAELKVIRMRLAAGKENKARRGELYPRLPPGYVWSPDRTLVKDPNLRVQEAIALVFTKFSETWSIRQTFKWFRDNDVQLPVSKACNGEVQIVFQVPRHTFIAGVLHNPIYAGAYVWGRRQTELRWEDGRLARRQGRASTPEEARVFLRDHHEGYIDWVTFKENERMIQRNDFRGPSDETAGAVRSGKGLLAGLLRCGRCGRKLHVRYWGKAGTSARYLCNGTFGIDGGRYCLGFGGATIDRRLEAEVTRVLSPLGVRASLEAFDQLGSEQSGRRRMLERQIEQLEYEVARAFEQYDAVDPRNRLVALELERRWNHKLAETENARQALNELDEERLSVTSEERAALRDLGADFTSAWNAPGFPAELKKQIVRAVIEEVLVDEEPKGVLALTVHWKGGTHTAFTMPKPSPKTMHRTAEENLDVIRKMATRYGDGDIARVLNKLGRTTGKGHSWSQQSVKSARRNHGIEGRARTVDDPEVLTLQGAARYTATSDTTIKKLVDAGTLPMNQAVPYAPWEIQRADLESARVRGILDTLEKTGRLRLGDKSGPQEALFPLEQSETKE